MTLATREETAIEELESKYDVKKSLDSKGDGYFNRQDAAKVARKILLEDAFRKGEYVLYDGKPITNLELLLRELLEHRSWNARIAALEFAFGKAPDVNKVEGGIEVVFKVEYEEDWIDGVALVEDSDEGA
jgi:hypothetical protein